VRPAAVHSNAVVSTDTPGRIGRGRRDGSVSDGRGCGSGGGDSSDVSSMVSGSLYSELASTLFVGLDKMGLEVGHSPVSVKAVAPFVGGGNKDASTFESDMS
jgi:hypothetical protein